MEVRRLAEWGLDHYRVRFPVRGMPPKFEITMELMDDFAGSVDVVNEYVSSLGLKGWRQRRRIQKRASDRYKARFDRRQNDIE